MAETIKGINVVIGAETTGLTAALADVNKATRSTQTELKAVERLLKFDPGNTELLAQKQQLLGEAVNSSREKLDRLKAAQEQVNAQFARGDIGESQYRAFNREVAAAEQQLSSFEAQLAKTADGLEEVGDTAESSADKLKSIGEKTKGVGEKMSVGISAPIIAAGGLMLKGAVDAENAQSKLQASLGLTAEEATAMGKVAQQVWNDAFGENIEEVDAAIATVRKNMGAFSDEELKKVTEGAMTIADVFDADVVDSTKAAGSMMKNFGISGTDALDLITVGFQKGGDYSGELLDTLNEYSPQFAAMGLSADQAMGMLLAGAGAGAFALDKVGDSVKEFNIRAQDGSKTTADGFAAIGLDAGTMGAAISKGGDDAAKAFTATVTSLAAMKDPMAQNNAGVALFGTQWEDVKAKVIIAMASGVKGVGEFKGATDTASKAMYDNNPAAALTSAMRSLQSAIGPALLPLASIITTTVAPAIKAMADGFNSIGPAGQKTILAVLGIAAVIGPLLVIIGPIISAIGGLVAGFAAISAAVAGGATGLAILTTAFPALAAAIAVITGPIGIAIALIAMFAAGAFIVIKNWGAIKEFFVNLWAGITETMTAAGTGITTMLSTTWEGIKAGIATAWTGISEFFAGFWAGISDGIAAAWEGIKSYFTGAWAAISGIFTGAMGEVSGVVTAGLDTMNSGIGTIFEGIKNYFTGIWEVIKNIFLGAILLILDLVTLDFTKLSTDAQAIWNNLKEAFAQIWEGINQVFQGAIDVIKTVLSGAWEAIKSVLTGAWNGIKTYLVDLWVGINASASTAWTNFKTMISTLTTDIANWIRTTWEGILTWFSTLPARLKQCAVDMFTSMKGGVTSTISGVKDAITAGMQSALNYLTSLPSQMINYGKNIIQGLIDGIKSMISSVINVVSDLAESIKNKIRNALKIASPSKVMVEIGEYTGQGLAEGMANTVGAVGRQAESLAIAAVSNPKSGNYPGGGTGGGTSEVRHSGTITVKGVNSVGEIQGVIDIIIDKLQMEARMA